MTIATYTDLKSAIANWLHRSDLSSVIPDFIALSESEFNRRNLIGQVTTTTLSVSGVSTVLPTGWGGVKSVTVTAYGLNRDIDQVDEQVIRTYNASGYPKHYAISGNNLLIAPVPDGAYSVTLTYWAKIDALSDSNPTNWLLTAYPDLYLWRGVCEGARYTRDNDLAQLAEGRYQQVLADIEIADAQRQFGPAPMMRGV
jgi:hypothetical protein